MHKFDPLSVSTQVVMLKSVTTALGGSISVLDEQLSTDSNEVTKRIEVFFSVARDFIQRHDKVTQYLVPIAVNLVMYQDIIITMERIPDNSINIADWTPISKLVANQIVDKLSIDSSDWYFDGRYIYKFEINDLVAALQAAVCLTDNCMFRTIGVQCLDTMKFHNSKISLDPRACIAFMLDEENFSISPPIWKSTTGIGQGHLQNDEDADDRDGKGQVGALSGQFDSIDAKLCVNLEFALRAAKEIGKIFGYEKIEPLQLPQLMVDLKTINLPSLSSAVKQTYAINMSFTQALAWILGLISRAPDDINTVIKMRQVIKHLTSRGIERKSSLDVDRIYHGGSMQRVKLESLTDALINLAA